jgi:non-ribosomal peptide synthase protein (TIGR01720 family)
VAKDGMRAVPQHGMGYGVLRYLTRYQGSNPLAGMADPPVSFLYLGQGDQGELAPAPFRAVAQFGKAAHSASACREHVIDVTAQIVDGQLEMSWTYSDQLHAASTVGALAQRTLDALRKLIGSSQSSAEEALSASDFPKARVNQEGLEKLLAKVAGGAR